jgi:hypothetical protein
LVGATNTEDHIEKKGSWKGRREAYIIKNLK